MLSAPKEKSLDPFGRNTESCFLSPQKTRISDREVREDRTTLSLGRDALLASVKRLLRRYACRLGSFAQIANNPILVALRLIAASVVRGEYTISLVVMVSAVSDIVFIIFG